MNKQTVLSRRFKPMGLVSKWIAPLIALSATSVASYLVYLSVDDSAVVVGCDAESAGCADVLTTQWSTWLGIPVSFGAIAVYATILLTLLASSKQISKLAWSVLIVCTTLAIGSGLWFSGLLYFDLGAFCPWCMTVHSCGLLLTIWLWLRIPIAAGEVEYKGRPVVAVAPKRVGAMVLLGLAGLAVLIGGQLLTVESDEAADDTTTALIDVGGNNKDEAGNHQDTSNSHDHSGNAGNDNQVTDDPLGNSQTAATNYRPFKRKKVSFINDQVSLMLTGHPVIGSPDAEHFIAIMFDYTCAACRKMHHNLRDAMERYNNQFAIIFMPIPLDSLCNPKLKTTPFDHRHACYYAKMSLAVWLAKPQAFDEFDRLLLKDKKRPSRKATRAIAERLVGKVKLDKALKNPAINEILRNNFNLFYSKALYKKSVPVLVTEKKLNFGSHKDIEELYKFIEENLGIHRLDESTSY